MNLQRSPPPKSGRANCYLRQVAPSDRILSSVGKCGGVHARMHETAAGQPGKVTFGIRRQNDDVGPEVHPENVTFARPNTLKLPSFDYAASTNALI